MSTSTDGETAPLWRSITPKDTAAAEIPTKRVYERLHDTTHFEIVCQPPHTVVAGKAFELPLIVRSCDELLVADVQEDIEKGNKNIMAKAVLLMKRGEDETGNSQWICVHSADMEAAYIRPEVITDTDIRVGGELTSQPWVYYIFNHLFVMVDGEVEIEIEIDIEICGNDLSRDYGKRTTMPVQVLPVGVPDPGPRELSESFSSWCISILLSYRLADTEMSILLYLSSLDAVDMPPSYLRNRKPSEDSQLPFEMELEDEEL